MAHQVKTIESPKFGYRDINLLCFAAWRFILVKKNTIEVDIKVKLALVYEEILWLSKRKHVTSADARSWYTHVRSEKLRRQVRQFNGLVSKKAIEEACKEKPELRLEHAKRLEKTLTEFFEKHENGRRNAAAFVETVISCEIVCLVTKDENYAAHRCKGDYEEAGITLDKWKKVPKAIQQILWQKALRSRVANAKKFAPDSVVALNSQQ